MTGVVPRGGGASGRPGTPGGTGAAGVTGGGARPGAPTRRVAPPPGQIPSRLTAVEWPTLPRRWVVSILPHEVPELAREIIAAIRAEIPEYRRAMDGPYGRQTRKGVEQALTAFMNQLLSGRSSPELDDVFRTLGRLEAQEGRSHDVLLAAYRIGSMVAWRRLTAMLPRAPLPPETVAELATTLFSFMDRLAGLSAQGYQEAQLARGTQAERLRARLAKMLLDQPATPMEAIASLADRVGWTLPELVQVIEVRSAGGRDVRALFGPDVLAHSDPPSPVLVVPAPVPADVVDGLRGLSAHEGDDDLRVTIGSAVVLSDAPRSLQWAQLASRLRLSGLIPDDVVVQCDDHLPTLLVLSNPAVADLLVRRRLGPLVGLSPAKRLKYARLLSAWLERGGSQADVAESLGLHRQTAHYQFARLSAMFGEALSDRNARVETLLALRGALLQWEAEAVEE